MIGGKIKFYTKTIYGNYLLHIKDKNDSVFIKLLNHIDIKININDFVWWQSDKTLFSSSKYNDLNLGKSIRFSSDSFKDTPTNFLYIKNRFSLYWYLYNEKLI